MKTPEKIPDTLFTPAEDFGHITNILSGEEFRPLLRKANAEYLYWDKFKYKVPKNSYDPRLFWYCLKLIRQGQFKPIPLKDKHERKFNFWLPDPVMEDLHILDTMGGGLISSDAPFMESKEKYLIHSLMEEAISSSLLEGAATTREKARDMLLSGKKPDSHPEKMVFNNYMTIKKLRQFKDQPLSEELLKEIHRTITLDTLKDQTCSGRFRESTDKPIAVKDVQGQILFDPPPVKEIETRIQDLVAFANLDNKREEFIHPAIRAILLHFLLAYIHPFVDGNGRTARAMFYWYMMKSGFWLVEYLSISQIFLEAPSQYARAFLYCEQDDSDLTYFIFYHLKALRQAIQELHSYIEKKQKEIRQLSSHFRQSTALNSRQAALLEHALRHPEKAYSIQEHRNYHGVAYQSARTDLLDLENKNILRRVRASKSKAFYFILNQDMVEELLK